MMYGVDYSDPGLRHFINEYLKAGGSTELVCYVGYFCKINSAKTVSTVSIENLLKTFKTEFENQKKVKQLRLERKLEKSKKDSN